jgi:thioredoxin-related protein
MPAQLNTGLMRCSAVVLLLLFAGPPPAVAADGIPAVDNLARTSQSSVQAGVPTLVFVSREACPYCRTLRDEILLPMQRADKFENRALLVEVSLDRVEPLTGFDGKPTTGQAFGDMYQAQITPTLLFLDAQGQEISPRIIGISNLELYGYYLQQSIDTALGAIRAGAPES